MKPEEFFENIDALDVLRDVAEYPRLVIKWMEQYGQICYEAGQHTMAETLSTGTPFVDFKEWKDGVFDS